MKGKQFVWLLFSVVFFLIFSNSCDIADAINGDTNYTLTVTLGTGVVGAPAAGSFNYAEGSIISYSYSLENNNYTNLEVVIDGNPAGTSGSITMNQNHTVTVTADVISASYDVRGSWKGTQKDSNGDSDPFEVTFTGSSALSGTTSGWADDPNSVGAGTYAVSGSSIDFSLWYGSVRNFQVTGTFANNDQMSGTWIWTNHNGDKFNGTWILNRN
ncbi:MAG: hypothetical protein ABFR75_10445 [Acidobacteriota bacterium]